MDEANRSTPPRSTEAEALHRSISASVRDMLDAYRIQAQAGPVTDQALEEILFRTSHGVCSRASRPIRASSGSRCCRTWCACCWPHFIEAIAATDLANLSRPPGGTAP
jgi:hypothetical protein